MKKKNDNKQTNCTYEYVSVECEFNRLLQVCTECDSSLEYAERNYQKKNSAACKFMRCAV